MAETTWKRQDYETWDEAFKALVPAVRQQSVRVADYTQVIFTQACKDHFAADNKRYAGRIRGQYADLAYKCGLYHQLGKSLVPPEYQLHRDDFTAEEEAVYRKYTSDGRELIGRLQEIGAWEKDKRQGRITAQPTDNIPWLMVREAAQQHMERFDGEGYPEGRRALSISPIAHIVAIAKQLDHLAAETKSEHPFEDAMEEIKAASGSAFDPAIVDTVIKCEKKCREIYEKYLHYSQTIPPTIPLINKRSKRTLGLTYRPMVTNEAGTVAAYECIPWFGGIANRPSETEGIGDIEELLKRTEMVVSVSEYFLYEATDTLMHINNCKLDLRLVLDMIPSFYTSGTQLQLLTKVMKSQPGIGKDQLILTIPAKYVASATKSHAELIRRYIKNGFTLLLDGLMPDTMDAGRIRDYGFRFVRFSPDCNFREDASDMMAHLIKEGITVLGGYADSADALAWQLASGVAYTCGTMTGIPTDEDGLIRDALIREREQ